MLHFECRDAGASPAAVAKLEMENGTMASTVTKYCAMCDTNYEALTLTTKHACGMPGEIMKSKPDSVGITENERLLEQMTPDAIGKFASNSVFAKEIWNAAIEAAAFKSASIFAIEIRKLKK